MTTPLSTAFLLLVLTTFIASTTALLADCSACDETLTEPVYYGCIGESAYVTYDSVKVDCGAALSLDQVASAPKFHYENADPNALYTLILVDTTSIDPIVGTVPPFLPFPVIHYGAMNIPGDVLIDGLTMDKFHYDSSGIRVQPFLAYVPPEPSDDLSKIQPDYTPPDINTRAFNHEFILGEQRSEKDLPLMDKNVNWEFVGFLRRSIVGNPVASTYITTGYCVKEVDEEDAIGSDCPVSADTGSGVGSVPAHVAVGSAGNSPAGNPGNPPAGNHGNSLADNADTDSNSDVSPSDPTESSSGDTGGSDSDAGSSESNSSSETDAVSDAIEEGETEISSSNGAFANRLTSAAAVASMAVLIYGFIGA